MMFDVESIKGPLAFSDLQERRERVSAMKPPKCFTQRFPRVICRAPVLCGHHGLCLRDLGYDPYNSCDSALRRASRQFDARR